MKPKNKYERQILKVVKSLTRRFEIERTKNGHIKVVFEGIKRATVIFSGSPSDHRAVKNARSEINKAMIEAGIKQGE